MFWQCCRVAGVFLPFVVAAWYFKKEGRRDPKFEPLAWAFWSGLCITALLFALFAAPFLSNAIWDVRRIWWSCLGDVPGMGWLAIVGGLLGIAYGRMNRGNFHGVRWICAVPLVAWLAIAPESSVLVKCIASHRRGGKTTSAFRAPGSPARLRQRQLC